MEEFIEIILGNPLLIVLIVGGLISLFRNKEGQNKSEDSNQRQQTDEQSKPKKSSPFGDFLERMEEALSDDTDEKPTSTDPKPSPPREPADQTMSAHDKRMEKMQQISEEIEAGTYQGASANAYESFYDSDIQSGMMDKDSPSLHVNVELNQQSKELRSQMKRRLRKRDLINSVIMSEVLGEPRSKQPYERRNMNKHRLY